MKYLLVLVLLVEIILTCLIPTATGYFFNKLESYDNAAWFGLLIYAGVRFALDVVQNLKPYTITLFANIKRLKLTEDYLEITSSVSNREQRIQEDIKFYTNNSITVYSEYFISFAIVVFLMVQNINHWILLLSALIYSAICIGSAALFRPIMIRTEKNIQIAETNFRDEVRLNIWPYSLKDLISINNKNALIKFNYGLCVKVQSGIMLALPYAALIPFYLAKTLTLGQLMEQASIFMLLVLNMSIIVNMYPTLMQAMASKHRIDEL